MAELAGCRKKFATNQNDLTGPASILDSEQARPSSADVSQFPVPTLQADDASQRTIATGPADPPQRDNPFPTRPARFVRHAFKLELFYRNVEDSDERSDRGARKRQDLLSNDEETSSSIYRVRHAQRKVNSTTDWLSMGLGEDENDLRRQEQECTSSAAYSSDRDRSSENRRVAELKTLEQDLVAMSDGKLNPEMLDVRPSSSMTEDDRERWDEIAAQLVVEMSDTSMTLGQLVNRISTIHSGKDGEDRLISEFEAFANSIAARVAEACGEVDRTSSGLFKSSATHEVESEQTARVGSGEEQTDKKFDIIIHGDHAEHVDDMSWGLHHSFGALRVEPWKDLGDILLGQMLRYVVSSTPTLLLRELVTVSLIRFALSCPVVSTSASSCKIVLSPAEALPSRFAATFFVYWKPIPLGSVPRLPSTSATRTTTSRSSRVSHIWLECHSRCPSNGNRPLISQLPFDERITKMFIIV